MYIYIYIYAYIYIDIDIDIGHTCLYNTHTCIYTYIYAPWSVFSPTEPRFWRRPGRPRLGLPRLEANSVGMARTLRAGRLLRFMRPSAKELPCQVAGCRR